MRSPHNLVQEFAAEGPDPVWRVLVVCTLLNKTHGRQVRPMIEQFLARFPSPDDFLRAPDEAIMPLLKPLGLYNRRLSILRQMTAEYALGTPVHMLPGVGEYAQASVGIFCEGRTDVVTDDPWLIKYLGWKNAEQDQ